MNAKNLIWFNLKLTYIDQDSLLSSPAVLVHNWHTWDRYVLKRLLDAFLRSNIFSVIQLFIRFQIQHLWPIGLQALFSGQSSWVFLI